MAQVRIAAMMLLLGTDFFLGYRYDTCSKAKALLRMRISENLFELSFEYNSNV